MSADAPVSQQDLSGAWTLRVTGDQVPPAVVAASREGIAANVPGVVHTDLLEAGLIPDPYLDTHEADVAWLAESATRYSRTFDATDLLAAGHERVDLVAQGLDTVATVTLNGTVVGATKNQHRSYRFEVAALLRGTNELVVDLAAPLPAARASEGRIGVKPTAAEPLPFNALRKMAANFVWDGGPTLTTSGIWRPIGLQGWSTARVARAVPRTTVGTGGGIVELHVDVEHASGRTGAQEVGLEAELTAPDGTVVATTATTASTAADGSAVLTLGVADPDLWWPRGHGGQPLYRASVRLTHAGAVLDRWTRQVGFRSAEAVVEPDADPEKGTSFFFRVNGQALWVKGANWVPLDSFPHRAGPEQYVRGVRDAVEADMNMLRVWGGGVYEADAFYELCDREGLLVWQDFTLMCACYSEAAEMWEEVEAEARENVARLASHPSVVLWNGGNENIEGYHDWGFADRLEPGEAWGGAYFHELLPRVLAEVDPTRSYIPSSPWNPADDADPTNPDHGPTHSWKVWFSVDFLRYRDTVPRFVAEFGFQGPPTWATLTAAVHDDPMRPDSPGMAQHQKFTDGNLKLELGWSGHLPPPSTFDDWHFTTQLDQARAVTCAVSHFRSHAPRTSGYLVWQLDDSWPAISWAAVDKGGRRKPLWYALRALNADRLLVVQPRGDGLALVASNDTDEPWRGRAVVRRLRVDGGEAASTPLDLDVAPRSNVTVELPAAIATPGRAGSELIVAEAPGAARAWWWFAEDVDSALGAPDLSTSVERVDGGYAVTVTARALVKDLALFPDRLDPDAVVDDLLVTLLPGESATFVVTTRADLDATALTTHPVLRSANDLLHPVREAAAR